MTRDLRRYAQQTTTRLVVGFVIILFVAGIGLIYLIYGPESALMGMLCLVIGLAPLVLIFISLWILNFIVKKANEE
jgi:hypothetical protein